MNSEKQRSVCRKKDLKTVEALEGIFRTTLAYNAESMLCHFVMKKGAEVPLHSHGPVQNGYVMSGKIKFMKEDGSSFIAEAGTGYAFGVDEVHGAEILEESEVIECFAPMRPEYADN